MPDVDQKVVRAIKGPPEYSKKVDMQKVNLEVMKQWISKRVIEILGTEDDVVIDYTFGLLEERFPDPKYIQYQLTGFLEKDTPAFCKQLWNLLLSAQDSKSGVPQELLEQKKEELRQEKAENERAVEEARRKREEEEAKSRQLDEIRQREREERRFGRGGGAAGRGDVDIAPETTIITGEDMGVGIILLLEAAVVDG
ncbi:PWI domain-containing protein [Kalaharituber pfeilii]|nr:PWI domain-containing protein [Kalaharituber pfeilii]